MKTYIIAEAGVNHNGDINMAHKLIEEAKSSGADCVKFQTFKAENLVTANAPKAEYQLKVTDSKESQFDMLKSLELKSEDFYEITKRTLKATNEFTNGKVISVLEGGYDLNALADSAFNHVNALDENN